MIVNGVVLDAQFVQWGNIILLIEHEVVLHRMKVDRTLEWVITYRRCNSSSSSHTHYIVTQYRIIEMNLVVKLVYESNHFNSFVKVVKVISLTPGDFIIRYSISFCSSHTASRSFSSK